MAHYAFLDENNIVTQVITGVDENLTQIDLDGTIVGGSTEAWEMFYENLPWFKGYKCKRTSYNGNFRKNYAGVGFFFDESLNAFIPPKPFNSWNLNYDTCRWDAPILKPSNGLYKWDEEKLNWVEFN